MYHCDMHEGKLTVTTDDSFANRSISIKELFQLSNIFHIKSIVFSIEEGGEKI